jgi:hypothetical protein
MPVRARGIDLDTFNVAQASIAAPVNLVGTSSGAATTAISTGAFTIDNPGTFLVTVFTPSLVRGTTNLDIELWDGATFLTSLITHAVAAVPLLPVTLRALVALALGSHNLAVKGFVDAGTGVFGAGTGATGAAPGAFITVQPV